MRRCLIPIVVTKTSGLQTPPTALVRLPFKHCVQCNAKRCLPIIEQMLNEPDLRVHALQERANILTLAPEIWKTYDSEGYSFFNINTPEDFEKAQTLL